MSPTPRPAPARLALVIGLLLHGGAHGAVVQWNNPAGGLFSQANNWSPAQVPGDKDTALFNLGAAGDAPYTVNGIQAALNRLVVGNDTVRLDFDRVGRLKLVSELAAAPGLVVGELTGQQGSLALVDGGILSAKDAVVGAVAGSIGQLTLDGAQLDLSGTLSVGSNTSNRVTLTNAARLEAASATWQAGFVTLSASELNIAGALRIGSDGAMNVELNPGTHITSGNTTLDPRGGEIFGNLAAVLARGTQTRWDILGSLTTLSEGLSIIEFAEGADLRTEAAFIDGPTTGNLYTTLWVNGAGSIWTAGRGVDFGLVGQGSMGVQSGGIARAPSARLGVNEGSSGFVTVSFANSRWEVSQLLEVGVLGQGLLRARSGGVVTAGELLVGHAGEISIRNAGSLLDVGTTGTINGALELITGGSATFDQAILGALSGADASVLVSGTGSLLHVDGTLTIGDVGKGTLTIEGGGRVESASGTLGARTSGRGEVVVRGAGSVWANTSTLLIGDTGLGTLTIENAGEVTSALSLLGNRIGGRGEVRVRGEDSIWTQHQTLVIGERGSGMLDIHDGATVDTQSLGIVGGNAGAIGDVTITGVGSRWQTAGALLIGNAGRGEVRVNAGGTLVTGNSALLGEIPSGDGELHLNGLGSRVEIALDLTVGVQGRGVVGVTGGAGVDVRGNGEIAGEVGSVGRVTLAGVGTRWDNALDLAVGLRGEGNLEVVQGATLFGATNGLIGHQAGAIGRAAVSDADSEWTLGSNLFVGFFGDGELLVANGGKVDVGGIGLIGNRAGSRGEVSVTGAGSAMSVAGSLFVGDADEGVLTVSNGAKLTSAGTAFIGFHADADGRAAVTGQGSQWTSDGGLFVAHEGIGELAISDGATLETTRDHDSTVGLRAGSTGTLQVLGEGSTMTTDQFVGGWDGAGHLRVLNGGLLSTTNGWIGFAATSESSALIAGGGEWTLDTTVSIGTFGKASLEISDGGVLRSQRSFVADGTTGRATVLITGDDSAWVTAEDFLLGGQADGTLGGVGEVALRDSGLLDVGGTLRVFDKSSLLLAGGTLRVRQLDLLGKFEFERGTLALTGPELRIGRGQGIPGVFDGDLDLRDDQHVDVVNGTAYVEARGQLKIGRNASFKARTGDNEGRIRVEGGALQFVTSSVSTGLIEGIDAVLRFDGGLRNEGQLTLEDSRVEGDVDNHGTLSFAGRNVVTGELGNAGEISLLAGGQLDLLGNLLLGELAGEAGTVDVDGAGSRLEVGGEFRVGVLGTGTFNLTNGAVLEVDRNGEIAAQAGSVGRVLLQGTGTTWTNTLDVAVGLRGEGELEIRDGATLVSKLNGLVGHQASASGSALVTGAGSTWTQASNLHVGYEGRGALRVTAGATLHSDRQGFIGTFGTARGEVQVDGAGSEWSLGSDLVVGNRGAGELTIADGASVTTGARGILGNQAGSSGVARVTGAGSSLVFGSFLIIGQTGDGDLTVADGATLETRDPLGTFVGSARNSSGTLLVTGEGSRVTTGQFVIGFSGDGSVTLRDKARLDSAFSWLGYDVDTTGAAFVGGASEWASTRLELARSGTASLDVVDGGVVRTGELLLAAAGRATVTVEGDGSRLIGKGNATLGGANSAATGQAELTVRDGGTLDLSGLLRVFDGSTLTLDGGTLRAGQFDVRGRFAFESGTVELTASDLRIGGAGSTPAPFGSSLLLTGDKHVNVVNGRTDLGLDGSLGVVDGTSFAARGGRNDGAILADSSTVLFTAVFENAGTFSATNATLRFDGGLSNTGAMRLMGARVEGDVHNGAEIVLNGANDFTGALSGNGVFAGTGSASLAGSLNPGNSPGLVSFEGDVSFEDTHMLTIELAGREGGVSHDQIRVAGRLALGGTLDVDLLDEYAPLLGDTFDIAIAAFIDGEFVDVLLPTLADGLRWRTLQLSDGVGRALYRLEVSAVPVPAAVWMLGSACVVIVARMRRR